MFAHVKLNSVKERRIIGLQFQKKIIQKTHQQIAITYAMQEFLKCKSIKEMN